MPTPSKPKTYCGDLEHMPVALQPLTKEVRWVVWSWELRTNKDGTQSWTKPLWQARNPRWHAKTNDPKTWGAFDDALKLVLARRVQGIGFTLLKSNIAAVDIDHVRDPNTGLTVPWAEQLIEEAKALSCYIEVTPSGAGYRVIGRAAGAVLHRRFNLDPKNGAAVELYRGCERYITVTALEYGQCSELPLIDAFIDTLLARYENGAGAVDDMFDLNTAAKQNQSLNYEDLIKNGAPPNSDRSDLFHSVVGHLYGQGLSEDDIIEELARHPKGIGAKYVGRLGKEVRRSYRKWQGKKQARTTGQPPSLPPPPPPGGGTAQSSGPPPPPPPPPPPQTWPSIRIIAGELPRVVDEAERALIGSGYELFQRGGMVMRPVLSTLKAAHNCNTLAWRLIPLTAQHLIEAMTRSARFLRRNERKKKWAVVDAPLKVAETYLAREGQWRLPVLTGVVTAPFLRPDGSLCERPGYDAATGLIFKSNGVIFPPIPLKPNRDDALEALAKLNKLIETFPFVNDPSRSVALSAILTALDRRAMATAPLHGFSSPVAGTGKSLLVDIIAVLTTGRLMPVTEYGKDDEEFRKQLDALLIAGDALISFDNCDREIGGTRLNQVLTQQTVNVRPLGQSRMVETLSTAAIFATGNNLTVRSDATRRVLMCTMDAKCERPETRTFSTDALAIALAERPHLVAAALTVLRAWHAADQGEEGAKLDPLGSFPDWEQRIRQPLVWLEQADPGVTIDELRKNDPERLDHYAVLVQWLQKLGPRNNHTVQQAIERAEVDSDFHAALMAVAAGSGTNISNMRLGRWLRRVEGKVIGGYSLRRVGMRDGYPVWSLYKE